MNSLYYVSRIFEKGTGRLSGYAVKDALSKEIVPGCPVFDSWDRAHNFLEGMLSVC